MTANTSITNKDAMIPLKHFLDRRPNPCDKTYINFSSAKLVLNLNTVQFDGTHYSQSGGVAMGTKMEPSFACLLLVVWRRKWVALCETYRWLGERFIEHKQRVTNAKDCPLA